MSDRVQVQKNSSAPSQMVSSSQFQERPFSDERYQTVATAGTITADSPPQPNTIRPSFNLLNMPIFAPSSEANMQQGNIQRQEEEQKKLQPRENSDFASLTGKKEDDKNQEVQLKEESDNPLPGAEEKEENQEVQLKSDNSLPVAEEKEENQEVQLKEESDNTLPVAEEKEENQEVQLKEESDNSSSPETLQEDTELKPIQTKLTVGKPGDKYEHEADSMAAKVMAMSDSAIQRQTDSQTDELKEENQPSLLSNSISRLVQRQTGEDSEELQMKLGLQRSPNSTTQSSASIENHLANSKGGGSPLPDEVRSFMEPRFGADFSSVRVHTDSTAVQMNKDLGAQAFAHGSDIYFGAGKSPGKNELTAHELTHTIQQTGGLRLNKQVQRQPKPEEEEKEPLQAKEIAGHTPDISLYKETPTESQSEEEQPEALQAKELPGQIPEISLNKETPTESQPEEEQPEALQAKELPSLTFDNKPIQAKSLEGGFTPSPLSIQRGIGDWISKGWNKGKEIVGAGLGKGRDLLTGGLDWVKNNIIQPLMRLASSGWSAVKGFGSQIANAFKQANPNIWDVFIPQHLVFRTATNLRRQLFAQAIQAERSQRARAAANIQGSSPAPVQEPSQLERLDGLMTQVESVPAAGFDIGKQLLEGAVVGDFNENPTIWNTIGQVAIGFVPYAGQVADIRDIVANVKKLHETGYKDPDAWINLVLSGIGIIPGVGDAIKAVGKGSKGAIRKALSGVLKNADNILRPALGKAKGLLNGARRYGKQFLGWASRQGAKLRQGVTQFAQKTVNFAKAAGQRARGLVTALTARIGGFVNGAMQRARDVANQAQGLLGKVMGPFMGMARKAFDAVQSRVSQAVNMVKTAAQRGKEIALKVGRKVADVTRKATSLLKEFTQSAIQKGREAVQKARQWSSQQIKRATELGRRLVAQARKRVADLVRKGIRLAKEKAIPLIKQKLRGVRDRIKNFLQDKWNRFKEKLGIKKPGEAGKEGAERGGKETTDNGAKKAAELPAAIAQAKAITEANDRIDTPVPALLGILNSTVKSRYSWIERFEARPKAKPGHYSIHMIASDHEIDPDYTTDDTKHHLYEGEIETSPQSPYNGKWNGKGIHEWDALVERCKKDGYNIKEVKEDPVTGVRRVTIERVGTDPKTGQQKTGKIEKTVYPKKMSRTELEAAGNQALDRAINGKSGTVFEPFGTKTKADGSPADGYFEASVPTSDGGTIRIQGWFKQLPDGTKQISSHAPRFDKSWPSLPQTDW
ncbi:DUF4157 domain-containing protein [Floridanema aerugineum]|uniref:DUF4157 domain-containing protein n=1 Tax=Floridaenema aerugineum BLCC-F46 TaxID=3153654 RepID=A0ABV4X3K7_9CYAN